MSGRLQEFRAFREKMNERILAAGHLPINRFFTVNTRAYEDGALDARTKEIAGLVALSSATNGLMSPKDPCP